MVTLFLISIAAICKALADNLAWKYDWFIKKFPKLKGDFWKINVVSKKSKKLFAMPLDAWHIANSVSIICLLACIFTGDSLHASIKVPAIFNYCLYGTWYIIIFNMFYNKVFR